MLLVGVSFAFSLGLEAKRPYVSMKIIILMERHSLRNSLFTFFWNANFLFSVLWLEKNALTKVLHAATRDRTRDLYIFSLTLSQLSYHVFKVLLPFEASMMSSLFLEEILLFLWVRKPFLQMSPLNRLIVWRADVSGAFFLLLLIAQNFCSSFQRFDRNPVGTLEPAWIQRARDFQPEFTATELSQLLG